MNTLQVTTQDRVAIIALNRGRSNAMNTEMVNELKNLIQNIEKDDNILGVILTGKEGFFCAGLDLIALYDYDEAAMRNFWQLFLELVKTLVTFKKPLVSAISGHSPAGGCVLALCSDARIMADGSYIIGLNEIPVGIIVPQYIYELYAFWIGRSKAYQNLLEGRLLSVDEALSAGLIDAKVDISILMTNAIRKIHQFLQFDAKIWQQSKLNFRKDLIDMVNADQTEVLEKTLQQWWSPGTRSILKTIIQNLQGK